MLLGVHVPFISLVLSCSPSASGASVYKNSLTSIVWAAPYFPVLT